MDDKEKNKENEDSENKKNSKKEDEPDESIKVPKFYNLAEAVNPDDLNQDLSDTKEDNLNE